MKYLIVIRDEDGTSFVVSQFDDLETARARLEFFKESAESSGDLLIAAPLWQSIELYKVDSIELHQIERAEP
jgi:hypothetical protein